MIEPKRRRKSEKFWDRVSKRFGNSNRPMNSPALHAIQQNADKYFTPTDMILDIGCGPGDITFEIARRTKFVYATDISEGMINSAKCRAVEQNISNTKFIRTNLIEKSFQALSFDAITAFNMLQYVTDKQQLYSAIYEYLKPQGLFISSTACLHERKSMIRFMLRGMSTLKIGPEILFYRTSELENEIIESGFNIIEAGDISKIPERFIVARKD
jgi:ubiquinone/menaquinone biosynthesis C-methylase UbiE